MNSTERVKATDQIDNILHRILAPKIKMIKKVEIFNFSRENSEFELFALNFFYLSKLPDESNTSSVAISGRGVISATDKPAYSTAYPAENT